MATGDDTFERPEQRRLPRTALAVAGAVAAAAVIGLAARPGSDPPGELAIDEDDSPPTPDEVEPEDSPEPPPPPDDSPDADAKLREATGSWSTLSEAPLSPRRTTPVWTGREVVVWGGRRDGMLERPFFEDGAAYEPDTDSWRELPPAPLGPRGGHVAVWADGELLVWGGEDRTRLHDDGAAYDPETDSWTAIPPGPLSPRRDAVGGWVGGELVVAGGGDNAGFLTDAAAYDPAARSWRTVSGEVPPGLGAVQGQGAVLGERWFVVWPSVGAAGAPPTFRAYDSGTDRWEEIEPPAAFTPGGMDQWVTATDGTLVAVSAGGPGGRPRVALHDGDAWDEVANPTGSRGRPVDGPNPYTQAAVADEGRVYVVDDATEPLRYDLADGTWTALPAIEPAARGTPPLPQHLEVIPEDDDVVVWLGGVDEAAAVPEGSPAGVVVWRQGE